MARIVVGFEGSCPQSDEGVRAEGPNRFRIFPSWRPSPGISEEAVGRSTRLGLKVVNDGQEPEQVELLIDWQFDEAPEHDVPHFASREEYMSFRDFVVVQEPGSTAWRTVMGDVAAAVVTVRLSVPPGETEVHWHPPYTYTQSEAFVASLRTHPLVDVERLGESEEGRNVWLLRITDESQQAKRPALIRARSHAYESGGSYAMEGMVHWLLSDDPWALAALRGYVFHIMPMANPDGVANGLGRLTAPRGANLCLTHTEPDPAHQAMMDAVESIRPTFFIDLHNWQNKHTDGLLGLYPAIRERFLRFMPHQVEAGKEWWIREPDDLTGAVPPTETLGRYCRRVFDAVSVSFEFPWFGRTPADVRATGRKALWALLRAVDELPPSLVSR